MFDDPMPPTQPYIGMDGQRGPAEAGSVREVSIGAAVWSS